MIVPTVAIQHPADREVRMVINASDFVEGQHTLWVEPAAATGELRVQRGARGLWFVKRDGEAVGTGHKTEAEAAAAMAEMPA
jgi:hypothetical protein